MLTDLAAVDLHDASGEAMTARTAALIIYPVGLAVGQVMFKLAAQAMRPLAGAPVLKLAATLALNPWFGSAVLLYAALSLMWVWILSGMPLSTAYPFVAVTFVLTPLFGHLVFDEVLGWSQVAGLALLIAALFLIVR